ncbi:MAG: GNAT family N-acetyltransferase [Alphaproteobacteria bacterium]
MTFQLAIAHETPDQPDVIRLLHLADAYSDALYPPESQHALSLERLLAEKVRFFVARIDRRAVGCGGYQIFGDWGEIKRMFVDEAARGQGVGRAIIERLEKEARGEGVRTMRLETGIHHHAAHRLYEGAGYRERGPFGAYGPDPLCRFMEKAL